MKSISGRSKIAVAPRRSIYRKLQIIIMEIARSKPHSDSELVGRIRKRGHDDFTTYKDGQPEPCSEEAVSHIIRLAKDLRLVDEATGSLTPRGEKSVDPDVFDVTVKKALQNLLEDMGAPQEKLKILISRLLSQHALDQLPTWEIICDNLFPDADSKTKKRFQEALGLYAVCGGIRFSRRKIYLPS